MGNWRPTEKAACPQRPKARRVREKSRTRTVVREEARPKTARPHRIGANWSEVNRVAWLRVMVEGEFAGVIRRRRNNQLNIGAGTESLTDSG